uniref:Vacuolar protein-sorting-associated protein 36 n=1 Tax=Panagrolaimus sp. JU765 TaxID=591449 RepID=A0AC34PXD7_9BILA
TAFKQGTLSLTLQRVIWADSSDPDCRLILHHSLVEHIDKHKKSMFNKGKIIMSLKSVPAGHPPGPVASSGSKTFSFVFKSGGEEEFAKLYHEALNKQYWKRSSSNSNSIGSRNSFVPSARTGGIAGIEKRMNDQHLKTHENISQAFEDMSKLMEQAREMVTLSKTITERLRAKNADINDDETTQFKSYLLSLGVSDPVTKTAFGTGATYFEKLAEEITEILLNPLVECGGTMTLPEAYCRVNRARGVHLISPEDLLNACQKLDKINSEIMMYVFESGVNVIQHRSISIDQAAEDTAQLVEKLGYADSFKIAKETSISPVLAKE